MQLCREIPLIVCDLCGICGVTPLYREFRYTEIRYSEVRLYRIIRTFFKFLQTVENDWDRSRRVTILCGKFM